MSLQAAKKAKITICLWFNGQASEAAQHYTSIFPNSQITTNSHFQEGGREHHGRDAGSVMTVAFELDGHPFVALNGGPMFKFSAATSFQVGCKDQAEVDFFWERLGEGGDEEKKRCGWLEDRFGVAWQVIPSGLIEMMLDEDKGKVARMTEAMMKMKKLDIEGLRAAFDGGA